MRYHTLTQAKTHQIDLVDLLTQAAPQVWGGDERGLLYQWLSRNTSEQVVSVRLKPVAKVTRQSRKLKGR